MPGLNNGTPADAPAEANFVPIPPKVAHVPSLRYPSNRKSIYDKNLNRTRNTEVSLASFAYLFNTLIEYHRTKSTSVTEIETRLNRAGYPIGVKLLDLLLYRQPQRASARPTRIVDVLQFVHGTLWRALFSRAADALEQSTENKGQYMIYDNEPVVNTYISMPKDLSQLNCAAFVAGIIEGVCDAAGFSTEGVTTHWAAPDELWPGKTVFLVKFKERTVEREEAIKAGGG